MPYNSCAMPKPPVRPPKVTSHPIESVAPDKVIDGEVTHIITGTIYRERMHSSGGPGAAVFANGGGSAPNGGGMANTALGGLMISNSCVIHLGKWCAYLKVETVKNYVVLNSDGTDEPGAVIGFGAAVADAARAKEGARTVQQVPIGKPRTYYVGKFDNEMEAKVNMDMVCIM